MLGKLLCLIFGHAEDDVVTRWEKNRHADYCIKFCLRCRAEVSRVEHPIYHAEGIPSDG